MFHSGRNCAACQPLLFSTAKTRHQSVSNSQCGWSCQAIFDISAIILNPPVRTASLYAKATDAFYSPHALRPCETHETLGFQCFRRFAPFRASEKQTECFSVYPKVSAAAIFRIIVCGALGMDYFIFDEKRRSGDTLKTTTTFILNFNLFTTGPQVASASPGGPV